MTNTVSNPLRISDALSLPLEVVTMTQAILARKRSGKSYAAQKFAEQMMIANQQVVAIDPTSAWWGLRSSSDGSGPGFPIVVFGGEHADVPLDHRAGGALARAVVEHGFSAIFDVGNMDVEEQVIFGTDFCRELLKLNRNAMHLFMDEAHNWAAQNPVTRPEKHALSAVKRLVLQGGIRGIGFTMISQRTALLNKDVLSQVDLMTVLRMSHPLDIKAVTDWIKSEVGKEFAAEVEKSLPSLPVGTAFISSAPLGMGNRIIIAPKETFNSGATPKPGERKVEPKVLAPIDIEKLGSHIAAAVREQRDSSPDVLRSRIAELEKKLQARPDSNPEREKMLIEQIQKMENDLAEAKSQILSLEGYSKGLAKTCDARGYALTEAAEKLEEIVLDLRLNAGSEKFSLPAKLESSPSALKHLPAPLPVRNPDRGMSVSSKPMSKACRSILTALVHHGQCSKSRIAALTGYALAGGGFNNALSECRTNGWMVGSDPVSITEAGEEAVGQVQPLPTGAELLAMWGGKLGKAEREILNTLVNHNRAIDKERLAEITGYASSGGGFNNALSRLRTLELIEGKGSLSLTADFAAAVR